jgi:dihydroorotate dehydrogenase (NAD+) catalytic subunit
MDRSFEWNAANGPAFDGAVPTLATPADKRFFGLAVNARFGLAASLGLNARWMSLYAGLGFDILTYKTVRRRAKLALPPPNWLFLEECADPFDPTAELRVRPGIPADPVQAAAVGSIGMPSSDPDFWHADIPACRAALRTGQVLIVSVVATADDGTDEDAFVAEFEELAAMVRQAGAQLVEANLSCPNVQRREGEVYTDSRLAGRIAAAVKRGAGPLPVLLKIGALATDEAMTALLHATDGHADGVVMINAPSRLVVDGTGTPAFGPGRERAGLMGGAVHDVALDCVRRAVAIVQRDGLGQQIVAVGGASTPQRVRAFLDAGACAALAASPAAWNPFLAQQVKHADPTI